MIEILIANQDLDKQLLVITMKAQISCRTHKKCFKQVSVCQLVDIGCYIQKSPCNRDCTMKTK